MDEDIEAEIGGGLPERLQVLAVERLSLEFRGNDHARKSEVDGAALQLGLRLVGVECRHMGEADEAAGMFELDLAHAVVDELALADVGLVEARSARQHAGIDARAIHHAQEGRHVRQQRIEQVVGIAVGIELHGELRRIALLQFGRRVVSLEIDDHGPANPPPAVTRPASMLAIRQRGRQSGHACECHRCRCKMAAGRNAP